ARPRRARRSLRRCSRRAAASPSPSVRVSSRSTSAGSTRASTTSRSGSRAIRSARSSRWDTCSGLKAVRSWESPSRERARFRRKSPRLAPCCAWHAPGKGPGNMLSDLRYAVRTLAKSRGFTIVTVATLAIGIGANTAIFAAIRAAYLRPLPYPDGDRIVRIWESMGPGWRGSVSEEDLTDWEAQTTTLVDFTAVVNDTFNLPQA